MSFLLKIVEGPNKGAEIALVEGLCVSLGKADSCDIILADPTLPDTPLQIEAAPDGVSIELPGEGRRHLEPYHVTMVGTTAFAVGSAESAWPALVWPKKDEPAAPEAAEPPKDEDKADAKKPEEKTVPEKAEEGKKRSGLWLVVILVVILLLLLLGLLGWIFRERVVAFLPWAGAESAETVAEEKVSPLDALIEKYSLVRSESDGVVTLAGDFETRAERLTATALAYEAQPGVRLDFADVESLRGAVEETLALVGEKDLRVTGIKNRVAVLSGKARDLRRTLEAVAADVPRLANVDCSDVEASDDAGAVAAKRAEAAAKRKSQKVEFPVCGILTSPYPCLVMSNGMRILEGAPFADGAIVKIESDKVVFTNSTGRVVWKP